MESGSYESLEKITTHDMYINSFYSCLDLVFSNIIDKDFNINRKKFEEFLKLPGIFSETFYNFLQNIKEPKKKKENFIEYCFVFFNPYLIDDHNFVSGMLFNFLRIPKEKRVNSKTLVAIIDNIIINLFLKSKNYNFEALFSTLIRINKLLRNALNNIEKFSYDDFINIFFEKKHFIDFLQFLFYSVSPIFKKYIINIKSLLEENKYNENKCNFIFPIEGNFLSKVFLSVGYDQIYDYSSDLEENIDGMQVSLDINNAKLYDIGLKKKSRNDLEKNNIDKYSWNERESLRLKRFEFNVKNLLPSFQYKKKYEMEDLFRIPQKYSFSDNIRKKSSKSVDVNENNSRKSRSPSPSINSRIKKKYENIDEIPESMKLGLEYFILGEKRESANNFNWINNSKVNSNHYSLKINSLNKISNFMESIFKNINNFEINEILFQNHKKIYEEKISNINEFTCFYNTDRNFLNKFPVSHESISNKNNNENSQFLFKIKIVDNFMIFFQRDNKSNNNKLCFKKILYVTDFSFAHLEFIYEGEKDLIVVTLKEKDHLYHKFLFDNENKFDKFIFNLIINGFIDEEKLQEKTIIRIVKENKYLNEFYREKEFKKLVFLDNQEYHNSGFIREFYSKMLETLDCGDLFCEKGNDNHLKEYMDYCILKSNIFKN